MKKFLVLIGIPLFLFGIGLLAGYMWSFAMSNAQSYPTNITMIILPITVAIILAMVAVFVLMLLAE